MDELEDLYTVRQVADYLRVGTVTVQRWIRAGDLMAIRTPGGKQYRIWRSDLDRFLRSKEV